MWRPAVGGSLQNATAFQTAQTLRGRRSGNESAKDSEREGPVRGHLSWEVLRRSKAVLFPIEGKEVQVRGSYRALALGR